MNIYIVLDNIDESILGIYDEETFKEKYKDFIINPPLYTNQNYWDSCHVEKWKVNSNYAGYNVINPEDIELLTNKKS